MAMLDPTTQVVATINDYPETKYNRLFPCTLTQLSPLHKVMVNLVKIDPSNDSDVYAQKNGGLSFTKISCLKLMTAANVIMEESRPILPAACQRCVQVAKMTGAAPQCGSCQTKQDVAYQVSILVPEPSGGHRRYIATKEISKEQYLAKKAPLEHMSAQCETKALLRALRAGLGIKGSYTKAELQKPFAVALVVLNTTDPELKAAMIQRYAAGESALFGAPKAVALPAPEVQALTSGVTTEDIGDGRTVDTTTGEVTETTVVSGDDDPPTFSGGFGFVNCEGDECGGILESFEDPQTGHWSVERLEQYTKENFSRTLCRKCALKATAAAKKGA
ncbi:MAG TPA: hypothetical protein DEF34_03175 [Desulfotomaculum sp.]|nr:MAG: hypothetical protein JL56_02795 [Desulfotomaculum sp. BICA1-6]HBX22629.1 hypothetical protein [Desulfotomaculum sp.]